VVIHNYLDKLIIGQIQNSAPFLVPFQSGRLSPQD